MSTNTNSARNLSEKSKDLLVCPCCNSQLKITEDSASCVNIECAQTFPIVDNIPVLLDESDSLFTIDKVVSNKTKAPTSSSKLKKLAHKILPALEANYKGEENFKKFTDLLLKENTNSIVLNIGGKHPGSHTAKLNEYPEIDLIESDVSFKLRANLIADPKSLPLPNSSVDAVVIDAVLEHVPDPFAVVEEVYRVLKPNGVIYADTPFMIQVHGGAYDFMRFSHLAHRRLFKNFSEVESGTSCGPAVALAHSIQYFLLSFVKSNNGRFAMKAISRVLFFWLKYFDKILIDKPGSLDAALGLYFLGRKSEVVVSDEEILETYRGIVPNLY